MFKKPKIKTVNLRKTGAKEIAGWSMPFTYEFTGTDGREYIILWKYDDSNSYKIKVFDLETKEELNGGLYSEYEETKKIWKILGIDVIDYPFRRNGIGTAMLKAFFEFIFLDDREFTEVFGVFSPKDDEKHLMNFYQQFNGYSVSNGKKVKFKFIKEEEVFFFRFF